MRSKPPTLCACQWGICGACAGDSDGGRTRHDHCTSRSHGRPVVFPLTWLLSKQGFVIGPPLWHANGKPCRWICPCPCRKTGPAPAAPPRRRPAAPPAPAARPAPAPEPTPDGGLFDLEVSS